MMSTDAHIRLYACDGGTVQVIDPKDAGAEPGAAAPIPWFLVTHPRGNVLIDGGCAPPVADNPVGHLGPIAATSIVTMDADQAVLPTLRRLDVDPVSVRWVLQSHLHFDHTGAIAVIEAFGNAQVLATRSEYEWSRAPDPLAEPLYCKSDFMQDGIEWALLEDYEDGYDVFGDGVLRCWRTPGHTPGHQSFEVHLPSGASFFITADAVAELSHLEERGMPPFFVSTSDLIASVRRIRRLAWRGGATVVVGHDAAQWKLLRHAPEFYD